jgi:hypothetical protein
MGNATSRNITCLSQPLAEIARRPTHAELDRSWRRARELGLKFERGTAVARQSGKFRLELLSSRQ